MALMKTQAPTYIIEIIIEKFILQQVQCFPLYSVLQALDNPKVDYFSLDIEGAEYPVRCNSKFSTFDIVKLLQNTFELLENNKCFCNMYTVGSEISTMG